MISPGYGSVFGSSQYLNHPVSKTQQQIISDTSNTMNFSLSRTSPCFGTSVPFGNTFMSSRGDNVEGYQNLPDNVKMYNWIIELISGSSGREHALLELSKKREQFDDLAFILWHSFGKL